MWEGGGFGEVSWQGGGWVKGWVWDEVGWMGWDGRFGILEGLIPRVGIYWLRGRGGAIRLGLALGFRIRLRRRL